MNTQKKDERIGLIAKIHVAKKQLAMEEESYRAMLVRVTGKDSLKVMNETALEKVLAELKRFGFKAAGGKRAGTRKMADGDQAAKIRALWLDLYHLGEISEPSEEALSAFVARMTGCRALQWITGPQADRAINALRGWLERVGFVIPRADVVRVISLRRFYEGVDADKNVNIQAIAWKVSLINRQIDILEGRIDGCIFNRDLYKPEVMDADDLDGEVEAFGRSVRERKAQKK